MYFLLQMQLSTSMSLRGTLRAKKKMITQGNKVVHIPNPLHSPNFLKRSFNTIKGYEKKKNSRKNKNKAEGSERVKSDAHSDNLLKPTKACILFKSSPKKRLEVCGEFPEFTHPSLSTFLILHLEFYH